MEMDMMIIDKNNKTYMVCNYNDALTSICPFRNKAPNEGISHRIFCVAGGCMAWVKFKDAKWLKGYFRNEDESVKEFGVPIQIVKNVNDLGFCSRLVY